MFTPAVKKREVRLRVKTTSEIALIHRNTPEEIFQLCEKELRHKYLNDTGGEFPAKDDEWCYYTAPSNAVTGQIGMSKPFSVSGSNRGNFDEFFDITLRFDRKKKTVTWLIADAEPIEVPLPSDPVFIVHSTGFINGCAEIL